MRGTDEKCHAFFRELSWEWFLWLDWAPRELLSRPIAEEKRGESTERARVMVDFSKKSEIFTESTCFAINYIENIEKND